MLVLMAVLHLGEDGYAPAVRTAIEARTRRPVSRGAVYVTLDRLDAKRLLTSRLAGAERGDGAGRPRRYYRVSARGLAALRRALAAVAQMRAGLEPLLEDS